MSTEVEKLAGRLARVEAERDAISKEWNDWASSHSAWIAEKAVLLAERDALKAELADYKESWEAQDMPCEEVTDAAMHAKLNRIKAADARIRARREKEAGKYAVQE
jgi:hypothetical protein